MRPTVTILAAPGTNRQHDLAFAFETAGATVNHVNVNDLPERITSVEQAQIIAVAGGFSYADALGSARVFASELAHRTGDVLMERIAAGTPVIGICNGFQMLVRAGILPGSEVGRATLAHNDNGRFECRWVTLRVEATHCVWTYDITDAITCPVAHGEGRFTTDDVTLSALEHQSRVVLRYDDGAGRLANGSYPTNPNGSVNDIAGICDDTGLVLGMMPHPENHVTKRQGLSGSPMGERGLALQLFTNGVQHVINA